MRPSVPMKIKKTNIYLHCLGEPSQQIVVYTKWTIDYFNLEIISNGSRIPEALWYIPMLSTDLFENIGLLQVRASVYIIKIPNVMVVAQILKHK